MAAQRHWSGRLREAEALYRRVLDRQPDHAEALHHLGILAHQTGRHDLAVDLIGQAIVLAPNNPAAHSNLGEAYRMLGRLDEAIASYRRALELEPNLPTSYNNLGIALSEQGRLEEAVAAHRRALELQPDYPEAHLNLGATLVRQNQFDEAAAAFRRALELRPDYASAHNNLGNVLKSQGELDAAIDAYRRAVQCHPQHHSAQSNLIYALHFHPGQDARMIAEEQHRWNRQFSDPLQRFVLPHQPDRSPGRRLRLGYVSPEFRDNVIGRYLLPLFRCHDHRDLEILCYSGVAKPDHLTEEFRRHADQWRSTVGVGDEALAAMIRQDGVDILVDLSQHTAGNRLLVFARQPAPIQVSFAAYPESTGLDAIEYRISDKWLEFGASRRDARTIAGGNTPGTEPHLRDRTPAGVPEGSAAPAGAEPMAVCKPGMVPPATVRQPSGLNAAEHVFHIDSYWCHDPCGMDLPVNGLPAPESGRVTFGCLNNFCKINEPLLRLWARVLGQVKDSRLILLTGVGSHRQRTLEILHRAGVEAHRVEFAAPRPRKAYLELYHHIDIALDPFPYTGHSTSLDALWMGVPVVSLVGEQSVSRAGWSQLSNLGLPELAAFSEDDYVGIATQLALDLPRLAELRRTLRSRMEASPLMDAPRFARNIEAAYRAMWRR